MSKIYGYGIDVSSYQPKAITGAWWKGHGAHYGIVKLSEGTNYRNAYAKAQIKGAKSAGIAVHGYHFASFISSVSQAVLEANYAVKTARKFKLPKGAIIVLDYERGQGVSSANNQAIVAFLTVIKREGYRPVFYSYSGMKSHYDANYIYKHSGATTWIAAYPLGTKATSRPLFNYFPSVGSHISAWQFTDNFKGNHVDGSVDITGMWVKQTEGTTTKTTTKATTVSSVVKATTKATTKVTASGLTVDGVAGKATIKKLQKVLGTTVDGVISGQNSANKKYLSGFTTIEYGTGGSKAVIALQKKLGVKADGYIGLNTVKRWQQKLGVTADGVAGKATIKAIQKSLNKNKLF